ncbi:ABC transporter permease subunit [Viridibacterium curvum]|uniref:ABC transporter permease subunit n=2 Tax=Viridibacterium curvum TaxID=1101404 RepID=A0ABP9R4N2_9RHOO
MSFDFSVIPNSLPFVWKGFQFSLALTVIATCGGVVLGTLLALARLSSIKFLRTPAAIYVDTLRSIPLLMVILWFFLLIPFVVRIKPETSALITFTLFEAAFFCEIIRAGIQSIPKGQVNAGFAIGMTYSQSMRYVILPQAFRNMVPVLLTQVIVLFQDTSLVYAIGASDLLHAAEVTGKTYNRPVEMYTFAALIYLAICFSLSTLVKRLHKRIAIIR